ncbi:MAG: hypothetical protein HQL52_01660 [Magnetococcales bacterium]|nr:hypothetical protein [Magnetococcales bacterium]
MSERNKSGSASLLEAVVSNPPVATVVVGGSILLLQFAIAEASGPWPEIHYLTWIVPFIPPFFITRAAKRINQRRAEYDFIKDAEPLVFVAFPKELAVKSLLSTYPDMLSKSASRHLQQPEEVLLNQEVLDGVYLADPTERERIASHLIEDLKATGETGTLRRKHIHLLPHGETEPVPYLMNSVLKVGQTGLKWQGTLIRQGWL